MARPIPASSILDALPSEVSRGLFAHGRSVNAFGKSNPEIYRDVMKVLARWLRDTNNVLAASSVLTANGRVAGHRAPGDHTGLVAAWCACAAVPHAARRGCLTANLGSEIGGIFQMPADVVGIGGAKNTTHFPDGAFSDAGKLGSEIEGIFQMPADVVGIGGAKNTTHIF
jgi:hypothetical protein